MTVRDDAIQALMDDAGCDQARATALVGAVAEAAQAEALGVVAGADPVSGSMVDTRVARLKRIMDALNAADPPPSPYEVGAIFRITPSQGRTLLNTYQARFSKDFRGRMEERVKEVAKRAESKGLGTVTLHFQF